MGQDKPESLLPPGFDDPVPTAPAPRPPATPRPVETARPSGPATPSSAVADPVGDLIDSLSNTAEPVAVDVAKYEMPAYARHSLARVGVSATGNTPFPATSLGDADGRYVSALLKRMNAPVASRWVSIALRRALMSPLDTPRNVNGADFAADRAWVLLRMGEASAARAVVNDVDTENYTLWMHQVAMQSALASADPGQMCGAVDIGAKYINQRAWSLGRAICAGLAGKPGEAGPLLDQARRGTSPSDVDNLLAEKVMGSGAQGRRAVTVEWQSVQRLTAWRFGMATAVGETIPNELYATTGPQARYWQALSPKLSPRERAGAAELAAAAGVFSNAGLVDLYAAIEEDDGSSGSPEAAVARDLRNAYSSATVEERMRAINHLWEEAKTPRAAYARLILTARAASWIPADTTVEDPAKLIASMLSAGYDSAALDWRPAVQRGSDAWALLALAESSETRLAYADFESFAGRAGSRKAQLMLAGLAGLGRLDVGDAERGAAAYDVRIGAENKWTRAIGAAGRSGDAALVAILAGTGMQSRHWEHVTPEGLFHIVAAMRSAGMANYARMIAIEAISRV